MGQEDIARSEASFGELLRNTHIYRREFVEAFHRSEWMLNSSELDAERFDALLEAIAKEDRAAADQILRVWGIR